MIDWEIGVVVTVTSTTDVMQHLTVRIGAETAKAVLYTDTHPLVTVGDRVLLNTTAVNLQLGTGGVHFVHAVLGDGTKPLSYSEQQSPASHRGHLMKMRYTSLQRAVLAAEEKNSRQQMFFNKDQHLEGAPVLIGELHSMLPAAALWIRHRLKQLQASKQTEKLNFVYIMSDGGALPLAWSEHVSRLKQFGLIQGTVTYGQAYGGDVETINKFTALLAARHLLHADIILVAMGPGVAGTGTELGHSAMEVGEIVNAASLLQGKPIIIPRISFADKRKRHHGISHHTLTALAFTSLRTAILPLPQNISSSSSAQIETQLASLDIQDRHVIHWCNCVTDFSMKQAFSVYTGPLTTMGRDSEADPLFFLSICAAAEVALHVLHYSACSQVRQP